MEFMLCVLGDFPQGVNYQNLFYFIVIGVLSRPLSFVSTMKNPLKISYGARALLHVKMTVDVKDLKNP